MLRYSYRTAKAQARLKRPYNDVDIFVEDAGNRNMWLLLARSLLPQGTQLASVMPLSGRNGVTKACKLDQAPDGRRKLYIVDGDFDYLLNRKKEKLKYFYRIKANNIENILISERAFVEIALEQQPSKTEEELRLMIDYNGQHLNFESAFRPLFVVYAVVQLLEPSIKTTSFPVKLLIEHGKAGPSIDYKKLRRRATNLYRILCGRVGRQAVRVARNQIAVRAAQLPTTRVVSGKDYLLPLLFLRLRAVCGYGSSSESFKVALARSFSPSAEPWFARRLRNL